MESHGGEPRTELPSVDVPELALPNPEAVRKIGRLRIPVTLTASPWATLFAYPDGRRVWVVRLWWLGRPVPRLVPTHRLRRYALESGLPRLLDEIDELLAEADRRERFDARRA